MPQNPLGPLAGEDGVLVHLDSIMDHPQLPLFASAPHLRRKLETKKTRAIYRNTDTIPDGSLR